jgi:hypothetical protein
MIQRLASLVYRVRQRGLHRETQSQKNKLKKKKKKKNFFLRRKEGRERGREGRREGGREEGKIQGPGCFIISPLGRQRQGVLEFKATSGDTLKLSHRNHLHNRKTSWWTKRGAGFVESWTWDGHVLHSAPLYITPQTLKSLCSSSSL